ncbi:hypothetical protein ABZP36_015696 [Zizania latifolia]
MVSSVHLLNVSLTSAVQAEGASGGRCHVVTLMRLSCTRGNIAKVTNINKQVQDELKVFVFLTAEYENSKNSLNQVSLWDHIIPDKQHANLHLEVKSKYPLIDQGSSLRGKKVQLVLHWHIMPKAGVMIRDRMALSEFKLPDVYTS